MEKMFFRIRMTRLRIRMYQDIGILKVLFQLEKRFVKELRKSRVRVRTCENGLGLGNLGVGLGLGNLGLGLGFVPKSRQN